ncbi:hypothetical protein HMPREF3036_02659 [Sutterella sp. KLE1602]|nr:hypothetical protein HMPREF3036_02659 [Sutterella sp. KLE1602]
MGRRLRACSGRQDDASASVRVRLCAESQSHLCHLPYSPSRIRQPMVREGWLKNGPKSRRSRGEEKFVPVSWEKALDLVAGEMKRVYKDYGPSAVFTAG